MPIRFLTKATAERRVKFEIEMLKDFVKEFNTIVEVDKRELADIDMYLNIVQAKLLKAIELKSKGENK